MITGLKQALIVLFGVISAILLIAFVTSKVVLTEPTPDSVVGVHESDTEDSGEEEHGEEGGVELSAASLAAANIVVAPLSRHNIEGEVEAPGVVKLNTYSSASITPRVEAQIVRRHARLGETIELGQPLVTLSSVAMAEAVGKLLVSHKEWTRVEELGTSIVSSRRFNEAKIFYEQAYNKALAYGMSKTEISKILETGSANSPGEFELVAPQRGTITADDFVIGELIQPGRVLFNIVDESVLWVEGSLAPDIATEIEVGANARIRSPDGEWLPAFVVQKHHKLDEETRTIGVRLEVSNQEDLLHPGAFVGTRISIGQTHQHLAVPSSAILKSNDGDWIVFVQEEPGHFKPVEIEVGRTAGNLTTIAGLPEGTLIVVEGAFFVQSELLKSGFEVHDH